MSIYGKDKTNLFLGYFTNLAEIQAQYPVGDDGQYAGANDVKKMYYWDVSSRSWVDSGDNYTGVFSGTVDLGNVGLLNGSDVRINPATEETIASILATLPNIISAEFKSPSDFSAVYTSNVTITLSALPFTITDSSQIAYIKLIPVSGSAKVYINGLGGVTMRVSSNVITISGAGTPFTTGDVYEVGVNAQDKAFDLSTNSQMSSVLNPDSEKYVADSLLDTTNVAAATAYYPSATGITMDGFKDLSLTGKFIDADGTVTMTVEASNDEDSINADWVQLYGWDTNGNAMVNQITVTNGTVTFALDFDNLNYSLFRVKLVTSGATNTCIIKARRKA